jgi:hypothetical protein
VQTGFGGEGLLRKPRCFTPFTQNRPESPLDRLHRWSPRGNQQVQSSRADWYTHGCVEYNCILHATLCPTAVSSACP